MGGQMRLQTSSSHSYWNRRAELSIEDECILWGVRVIVPIKLREEVLKKLHQSHIGIMRMKMIVRSYVCMLAKDRFRNRTNG